MARRELEVGKELFQSMNTYQISQELDLILTSTMVWWQRIKSTKVFRASQLIKASWEEVHLQHFQAHRESWTTKIKLWFQELIQYRAKEITNHKQTTQINQLQDRTLPSAQVQGGEEEVQLDKLSKML